MQSIAFLTTADLVGCPIYDNLTVEPLRALGFAVESVDWRTDEDWDRFAAVLPRSNGDFELMEAELIEPSLYFSIDPQGSIRFAEALAEWLDQGD